MGLAQHLPAVLRVQCDVLSGDGLGHERSRYRYVAALDEVDDPQVVARGQCADREAGCWRRGAVAPRLRYAGGWHRRNAEIRDPSAGCFRDPKQEY